MERTQMTFYASFWDAVDSLPKKDQLPVFRAVISYGLSGTHSENLSSAQNAFFTLMKPVLDASIKKAVNGKHGGSKQEANRKQNESKTEANRKQTESKREREKEKENEIEYECKKADFDLFWQCYPRKVGKVKAEAAFGKVTVPIDVLIAAIEKQKATQQWTKDNGQFVPHPATWLNGKRWEDQVDAVVSSERRLDEDEVAAIRAMMGV